VVLDFADVQSTVLVQLYAERLPDVDLARGAFEEIQLGLARASHRRDASLAAGRGLPEE
jgi:hypothetical protein